MLTAMEYVTVMLEEYKSVRQESLEALNQIHTIVQYGLASIGLSVGLGLVTLQRDVTAAAVVLMGLVPTLIIFGMVMTGVSVHRVLQTRIYLRALEAEIADRLPRGDLRVPHWERSRAARSETAVNAYPFAILASIGVATILGPVLGGALLYSHGRVEWFVVGEWLDCIGILYFAYRCRRRYSKFVVLNGENLATTDVVSTRTAMGRVRRVLKWAAIGSLAVGIPIAIYGVLVMPAKASAPEIDVSIARNSSHIVLTAHVIVRGVSEREQYSVEVDAREYRQEAGAGRYIALGAPLYEAQLSANNQGRIKSEISIPLSLGPNHVVSIEAWYGDRPGPCHSLSGPIPIGTLRADDPLEEMGRPGCVLIRLPKD